VGHEAGDDQVGLAEALQALVQIRLGEGVRQPLDHRGLVAPGRDRFGDAADLLADVVGRAGTAVVHDMDDRRAGLARPGQQARGLLEGRFDAAQLHDARGVGVLAVDHDHDGLAEAAGRRLAPGELHQGLGSGHGAPPCGSDLRASCRRAEDGRLRRAGSGPRPDYRNSLISTRRFCEAGALASVITRGRVSP
jgi:hypothetical protein